MAKEGLVEMKAPVSNMEESHRVSLDCGRGVREWKEIPETSEGARSM